MTFSYYPPSSYVKTQNPILYGLARWAVAEFRSGHVFFRSKPISSVVDPLEWENFP